MLSSESTGHPDDSRPSQDSEQDASAHSHLLAETPVESDHISSDGLHQSAAYSPSQNAQDADGTSPTDDAGMTERPVSPLSIQNSGAALDHGSVRTTGTPENIPMQPPKKTNTTTTVISVANNPAVQTTTPLAIEGEKQPKRSFGATIKDWRYEMLLAFFSVLVLIGLCIFLWWWAEASTSFWTVPWEINSVIAFMTTIMDACIGVCVASSLGQLKWLRYRNKARSLRDLDTLQNAGKDWVGASRFILKKGPINFAALGAFLVICALGMDTFTQQVITQRLRNLSEDNTAWVPRGTGYDDWDRYTTGNTPGDQGPYPNMVAAIYNGFFTSSANTDEQSQSIATYCWSGNCTLGTYQSLGVAYKCANITDKIINQCGSSSCTGPNDTYALPGGLSLNTTNGLVNMTGTTVYPDPAVLPDIGPMIAHFSIIASNSGNYSVMNASAVECAVYWIVNTYVGNITSGVLSENITHSWTNLTASPTVYGQDTDIILTPPGGSMYNGTTFSNSSSNFVTYNVTALAQRGLQNFLTGARGFPGFFNGQAAQIGPADNLGWNITGAATGNLYNTGTNSPYLWGTVNSSMYYLTTQMTRTVRERAVWLDSYYETSNGTTLYLDQYFHVRWGWMAYPIAFVVFAVIFLITTIILSRHQYAWKSSFAAIMLHGLGDEDRSKLGPLQEISQMEKVLNERKARLDYIDGNWRLISEEGIEKVRHGSEILEHLEPIGGVVEGVLKAAEQDMN